MSLYMYTSPLSPKQQRWCLQLLLQSLQWFTGILTRLLIWQTFNADCPYVYFHKLNWGFMSLCCSDIVYSYLTGATDNNYYNLGGPSCSNYIILIFYEWRHFIRSCVSLREIERLCMCMLQLACVQKQWNEKHLNWQIKNTFLRLRQLWIQILISECNMLPNVCGTPLSLFWISAGEHKARKPFVLMDFCCFFTSMFCIY